MLENSSRPLDATARGRVRWAGLAAGAAAFCIVYLLPSALGAGARGAAATTVLMAIWWFTEALPIHWTACVPLLLFPALGVFDGGAAESAGAPGPGRAALWVHGLIEAAGPFGDAYIFLFVGGMALAAAMQESNLHRRIALGVLVRVGVAPARLLLGFLLATAAISLWISNTATAAMMVPIAMAVVVHLQAQEPAADLRKYSCALLLAVAYGANIGGIGSKIGTAPNAQFCGFMEQQLGIGITFLDFLLIGLPFVVLFLPLTWWVLWQSARSERVPGDAEAIERERRRLGAMTANERVVLGFFTAAVVLWIMSAPLQSLLREQFASIKTKHVEAGVALLCGFALLVVPARGGRRPLTLAGLRKVPWETLLLLGGGFSLAHGVAASGLSEWMAGHLEAAAGLSPFLQLAVIALLTVFLSAFASNTATIAVLLPVIHGAAATELAPAALAAATIACSCDFMLPAGTPPNAIVFGSGYVSVPRMVRIGCLLDVAAALLVSVWAWVGIRSLLPP